MRRQMRLIRKLLAYVNGFDHTGKIPLPRCDEYTAAEIAYHVLLCKDAGYLVVRTGGTDNHIPVDIERMTWAGHEKLAELEASRSEHDME